MNTETCFRTSRIAGITSTLVLLCVPLAHADAVTDWNAVMTDVIADEPNPAAGARTAVIAQVAVFEAVNSITGDYEPYRRRIEAPEGASASAAAIAAAYAVLVRLHPDKASQLGAQREKSLAAIPEGRGKVDVIGVGVSSADVLLALRARDGFDVVPTYSPGMQPGDYRPTPPDFTPAFMPGLGEVNTFVIRNGRQFRAPPPPDLRSKNYFRDFEEVKQMGEAHSTQRSAHHTEIARFYAATDVDRIYYPAARQVSDVPSRQLTRPDTSSPRSYPTRRRKASLASRI